LYCKKHHVPVLLKACHGVSGCGFFAGEGLGRTGLLDGR
jgi:hypothetical protein